MNDRRLTLAVLLILALASVKALAVDRARLTELVVASRVHLSVAGAVRYSIETALAAEKPELIACYRDLADDSFLQAAVDYLATRLTDADVEQGLAFYATPLGKRIAANNHPNQRKPLPFGLNQQEFDAKDAFAATRAGSELLASDNLLHSEVMTRQVISVYAARREECGIPQMNR
jgi:hypothetical protein